jgi:hypothetical protein
MGKRGHYTYRVAGCNCHNSIVNGDIDRLNYVRKQATRMPAGNIRQLCLAESLRDGSRKIKPCRFLISPAYGSISWRHLSEKEYK